MNTKSLTRKWHGLPVWAWAAIVAVMLFLLYRYFQGRNSGATASGSNTPAQADTSGTGASSGAGGDIGLPSPLDNTIPYDFYGGLNDPYYLAPMTGDSSTNNHDLPNVTPATSPPDSSPPPNESALPSYSIGTPIYPANTFTSPKPLGSSYSSKQLAPELAIAAGKAKPLLTQGITLGQPQEPVYSTLPNLTPVAGTPKNLKSLPTDVNRAIQTEPAQAAKVRQIGL